MRIFARTIVVVALALLAGACTRGPDEAGLERDVQARLDAVFGRPVLVVRTLKRQGSAPLAAAQDGARQAIVYYNARLEFTEAYRPSDWEGLSPQLIADALGATDQGVVGLGSRSMAPGTELRAYGSMVYRRTDEEWQATDASVEQPPSGRATPAGSGTQPPPAADLPLEPLPPHLGDPALLVLQQGLHREGAR